MNLKWNAENVQKTRPLSGQILFDCGDIDKHEGFEERSHLAQD